MIVKAVTNHSNLVRYCKDYRKFCESGLYDILEKGGRVKDKLFEIQSSIHTFKGNFNQLDMAAIVKRLHDLETDIAEMKWKSGHLGIEDIRLFINGLNMSVWLDEDLSVLNEILGEQYLDCEKAIIVDQVKLLEIERKMSSILSTEQCGILLPEIRQLRYSPLRELMRHYPDYVLKLSRELGKSVYPLAIEGGDFLVDPEKLQDFLGTLVHVFRNALDHGIEKPIERISARKDECGTIKCSLKLKDQKIVIEISDDGRGIYTDNIKNIAVTKGFYDEETVSKLPGHQILALVFKEYFSTKENVNEFSGRGIGLAAVKTELEKAGGSLEIETEAGMGTKFIFILNHEK